MQHLGRIGGADDTWSTCRCRNQRSQLRSSRLRHSCTWPAHEELATAAATKRDDLCHPCHDHGSAHDAHWSQTHRCHQTQEPTQTCRQQATAQAPQQDQKQLWQPPSQEPLEASATDYIQATLCHHRHYLHQQAQPNQCTGDSCAQHAQKQ